MPSCSNGTLVSGGLSVYAPKYWFGLQLSILFVISDPTVAEVERLLSYPSQSMMAGIRTNLLRGAHPLVIYTLASTAMDIYAPGSLDRISTYRCHDETTDAAVHSHRAVCYDELASILRLRRRGATPLTEPSSPRT